MKICRLFLRSLLPGILLLVTLDTYAADGPELPIPSGTKLSLQLLSPISTASSKKGDKFSCKVLTPAEYAGAIAEGYIRDLKRSGKANKESRIDLAFKTLTMPDGRESELSATVIEVFDVTNVGDQGRADNEGTVRNKSTTIKTSVKRAAAGALIGAVLGGVVGGGQGAAIGAAVGASIGATTTLATRGPDLEFKEGTQFTVECSGPTKKRNQPGRAATSEPTGGAPSKPGNAPDQPSRTYRAYSASLFSLSVPDNWQENAGSNEVSFVPDRGYVNFKGRKDLTHGAMVGISPLQVQDLEKASEQLVGLLLQTNPNFRRQGSLIQETMANRNALSAVLSGMSKSTARMEQVTVHCAMLSNRSLFYLITVVPQDEYPSYREAFDGLLRSIQFNN